MQKSEEYEAIFYPKSVAVVGASADPRKGGYRRFKGLLETNFKGQLYPVNPKETEVFGLKAYSGVKDIPGEVDQVIISIPAPSIPEVLEECIEKGVKVAVVYAAGFSETGETEGQVLEQEMAKIVRRGKTRIIGPNCIGIYCPEGRLSFFPNLPTAGGGSVSFVAQSGGLSLLFVQLASFYEIKCNKVISFGNGIDLESTDFLEYLNDDPETKIIAAYIEGVKDGQRFLRAARRVAKNKPLLIWKAGKSEAGAKAAASHTGSLTGSDQMWDALFRQAGALRTGSLEELVDAVRILLSEPQPLGRRTAIVTGGGGAGVAAADICGAMGLELAPLSSETKSKLREIIPPSGTSIKNPIDLAAWAFDPSMYLKVIKLVIADKNVDTLVVIGLTDLLQPDLFAQELSKLKQTFKKTLLTTLPIISEETAKLHRIFSKIGVLVYPTEERAIKALANLIQYYHLHGATGSYPSAKQPPSSTEIAYPLDSQTSLR